MARDPSGGLDPVAAIIVETVQGEGGLNVASIAWLRTLRKICTEIGALLIVDDVQAGCGRTGDFFSFERAGIVPDMVCLSKSISGAGLPMALLLVLPQFDVWKPGEHNGTFRGNSLAFVAATAAMEEWRGSNLRTDIETRSSTLDAWLDGAAEAFPDVVERKKGLGMMAGLRFHEPRVARAVADEARNRRILLETCGPYDEVIKIFPPLNIEADLLSEGLGRLGQAIETQGAKASCDSRAA
ncbi:aminotransferase class III-fold pyridoxal phosphate-dependent enzyme [Bradyrhizobium sp. CB1717]|uniref:aminotransferase class III-fold pyridoxal phosphate-dependent enzyme n=1 Tax=Bradyrhizobium sp. CB1717 TaxID=3039154 RepID=UPI0024B213FE|nr:aminotransferase class III-fold pyridoxal phosphate-dependent enzyme [Bradyrhizobium sp. CB1717]WFU26755.1 aminotransferase class III-fold pyridoxal phosphate-dependent enzyme [Bradyrhizobium sp. CB1717]